jgi:two-component system sensor histidine kinase ChvG
MREMTEALKLRLTAIEQFAADVAHELKNPISSMKSALETLPKVKNDDDRQRLMMVLHHDLQRMDRLISDISQASRLDAELSRDVLIPLDIRNILNSLIDVKTNPKSRRPDETQGQIKRVGFEYAALVRGQSGRLAQVFDNLISNALSFSKNGSSVTVRIEANDERVKIMVEDEGPGIPESRLDKIFDRFYSERPVSEGFGMHSGLGLSIAKQIIESHSGTIHAENRKNAEGQVIGARFIVRLGAV